MAPGVAGGVLDRSFDVEGAASAVCVLRNTSAAEVGAEAGWVEDVGAVEVAGAAEVVGGGTGAAEPADGDAGVRRNAAPAGVEADGAGEPEGACPADPADRLVGVAGGLAAGAACARGVGVTRGRPTDPAVVAPVTGRIASAPANPEASERVASTPNAARRRTVISSGIAIAPPAVGAACAIAPESSDATGRGSPICRIGAGGCAAPRSGARRIESGADGDAVGAPGDPVSVAAAGACVAGEVAPEAAEVGAAGAPAAGNDEPAVDVAGLGAFRAAGAAVVGAAVVGAVEADAAGVDAAGVDAAGLGAVGAAGVRRISVGDAAGVAEPVVVPLPDAGCAGPADRADPEDAGGTDAEPAAETAVAAAIPGATVDRPTCVAGRIAVSTTSGLHIRRIERAVVRNRLPGAPPNGAASISRAVCCGAGATAAAGEAAGPDTSPGATGTAGMLVVPAPTDRAASLAGTGADGSAGRRWIVGAPGMVDTRGAEATCAEPAGAWEPGADAAGADAAGSPRTTAAIAAVGREMSAAACPTGAIAAVVRRLSGPLCSTGAVAAGGRAGAAAARRIAAWRITTLVAPHRSRREDGAAVCERVIRSEPPGRIATGDDTAEAR